MRTITLLTDFGLQDPYVGVMKGVIAALAPEARVIDLCHLVEPYQVPQARFLLMQNFHYFPQNTVHVCVVDPGVGSARRPLAVKARGHLFVGPDNGLFSDLFDDAETRVLDRPKYHLKNSSQTFHGRDLFSPVAAHLAKGVPFARLGTKIADPLRLTTGAPVRIARRVWQGEIVHIDRFGNLITNLEAAQILPLAPRHLELKIGLRTITERASHYAAAPDNTLFVIAGSAGTLEISLKEDSAARKLGVGLGAPVEVEVL